MLWAQQCMSGDAASKYRQRGRITGLQVCIGCSNYLYLYQIMLNNQQQASTLPTSIVHNRRGQDNRQLMRCIHSTTPHVHSCECYRSLEISEDYVTGLNFVNLNRQDRASCTIKLNNPQLYPTCGTHQCKQAASPSCSLKHSLCTRTFHLGFFGSFGR